MSIKIENLINRPVLLRLNSGQTLHLAPRTTSKEIMEVEVQGNSKVQKLQGMNLIILHEVKEKQFPPSKPKEKKNP